MQNVLFVCANLHDPVHIRWHTSLHPMLKHSKIHATIVQAKIGLNRLYKAHCILKAVAQSYHK